MCLLVERHRSNHDAGQSTENKKENESEREQQRRVEARPACPQRGDPAEHLHTARYCDHHARCRKKALPELWQSRREHVMHPQPEAEEPCGYQ
jgi:hypothetical protein